MSLFRNVSVNNPTLQLGENIGEHNSYRLVTTLRALATKTSANFVLFLLQMGALSLLIYLCNSLTDADLIPWINTEAPTFTLFEQS